MRFSGMAESIWSDGVGKAKPNPGAEPTASRWSAPRPGQRTRREEHAPSHRPQMSSDRLFLDRVGRHQSPSPLHRHEQNNMHSASGLAKGDISTLLARGHFYFALTRQESDLTSIESFQYNSDHCFRQGSEW